MNSRCLSAFLLAVLSVVIFACSSVESHRDHQPQKPSPAFTCVPLGVTGGLLDGNLSAYLVAASGTHDYVCLDAGTVLGGLVDAVEAGAFPRLVSSGQESLEAAGLILKDHVKAYLLSHAHFDHLTGLIISSPADSGKPILALTRTIELLKKHVFNGSVWANFANEGPGALNRFTYVHLNPGEPVLVEGTELTVRAMSLNHAGPVGSTAFLLEHRGNFLLYLGDVGPDEVAGDRQLEAVWRQVAPLVRSGSLRGVMLECSYADPHDEKFLYGHLTPSWFMVEMSRLAALVSPESPQEALAGLCVAVTHIKPLLDGTSAETTIRAQLKAGNNLGLELVFPRKGERIDF